MDASLHSSSSSFCKALLVEAATRQMRPLHNFTLVPACPLYLAAPREPNTDKERQSKGHVMLTRLENHEFEYTFSIP